MARRALIGIAMTAALVLAACGDDGGGGGTVAPTTPAGPDVDGRTFLVSETVGAVSGYTLVAGTTVRISFVDGNVGASAGCNSMGGAYTLEGDVMRVDSLARTEMACEPALMAQDDWLAGLLTSGPRLAVSGDTLTVTSEATSLSLVDRRVAEPDRPLKATTWVVDGLMSGDAVSSVPLGVEASITIDGDRMLVRAGCNQGSAPVEADAPGSTGTITLGPLTLTKMACDADRSLVEAAVVATLAGEVDFTIEADRLTLMHGTAGLILVASG